MFLLAARHCSRRPCSVGQCVPPTAVAAAAALSALPLVAPRFLAVGVRGARSGSAAVPVAAALKKARVSRAAAPPLLFFVRPLGVSRSPQGINISPRLLRLCPSRPLPPRSARPRARLPLWSSPCFARLAARRLGAVLGRLVRVHFMAAKVRRRCRRLKQQLAPVGYRAY